MGISPTKKAERVFTTLSHSQLLLTTPSPILRTSTENSLVYSVTLDDSPTFGIGTPLITLGIPVFGIITGILVLPSPVDGHTRVLINYYPLPQPNIGKTGTEG